MLFVFQFSVKAYLSVRMFVTACRFSLRCQKLGLAPIQTLPVTLVHTIPSMTVMHRSFCSDIDPKDITKVAVKKERTKTVEVPKITLLDENDKIISITTMAEAEKIASSKKLGLVQIVDQEVRTVRSVFKLMSEAQYIEEDLKLRKQKKEERKKSSSFIKGEKMMIVTSKITTFDLDMKLRKIMSFLEKKYEVHILISGSPESSVAQVINLLFLVQLFSLSLILFLRYQVSKMQIFMKQEILARRNSLRFELQVVTF